jgi:peroxiredoxin
MLKFFLALSLLANSSAHAAKTLEDQLSERRSESLRKSDPEKKKIMGQWIKSLKEMGLDKKALGVGQKVPLISLQDLKGSRVSLKDFYSDKYLVLTFYRGSWCPYCMLELDAYQKMINLFNRAGAQIVAVSPDTVKEGMKMKKKRDLTFTILSDPDNLAAKKLGLALKVDETVLKAYKGFGIKLDQAQGNTNRELPMPGTYVIDKSGVIRYSFVDPDYTKRAEPSEVLKVVRSLKVNK